MRGTKYPIPLPKGGKNSKDIILTEDEYMRAMRKNRSAPSRDEDQLAFGSTRVIAPQVMVGYGMCGMFQLLTLVPRQKESKRHTQEIGKEK